MHILLALWLLFLNIKNKTWRYIPKFIPSILYVSSFNSLYYFICKDYLVWDFKSKLLSTKQLRFLHILVINPLMILLFLAKFPRTFANQVEYMLKWVGISTFLEWIAERNFQLVYFDHGWHIGWSVLIYLKMYLYSLLMIKNAMLTFILSAASTTFFVNIFKVPIKSNILQHFQTGRVLVRKAKTCFGCVKFNTLVVMIAAVFIGIRTVQKLISRSS